MAYKPTRMDQIKKIIEYYKRGISKRKIARILGISRNTVKQYIRRFEDKQLNINELSDEESMMKMYESEQVSVDVREDDLQNRLPDIVKELRRTGVTRYLLWEEYIQEYPEGFSYSRFCRKIRQYKAIQGATIKIDHKPAYHMYVDYAGKKVSWVDRKTGEVHEVHVLVCTLPYSGYTFAIGVNSERQEDFIHALNQCFMYIGGVPQVLLSDNLKSYVTKANRYEPTFSELCIQLSMHYGIELEAARVGKPKDKGHVERHVSIVYNRLYAPLRNEAFYSLEKINEAFTAQLIKHNEKNFQGKDHSRKDLFEQGEKSLLSALPTELFEIKKCVRAKVQRNYHVILGEDKHQYSVPYKYIGKTTEVIYTSQHVEIYLDVSRIAIHKRDRRKYGYSTHATHMPEKHKKYLEQRGWDAAYFTRQAEKIGENTAWAIKEILKSKAIIEQTYNACLGVLRMARTYSPERLENACARARTTHRINYTILKNILKKNLDSIELEAKPNLFTIPDHQNIRGAKNYY